MDKSKQVQTETPCDGEWTNTFIVNDARLWSSKGSQRSTISRIFVQSLVGHICIRADSDVVLLDDPLSAVDAHVGQHLWSQCVCGLLATRTRVLVSHHMHFLPFADLIAVVEHGKITHLGNFTALESEVGLQRRL